MRFSSILCLPVLLLLIGGGLASQDKISRIDRTRMRETRETMRAIALSLRTIQQMSEDGAYPDALKALVDNKLEEAVPKDAWGREFSYALSIDSGYELTSWGADGKAGGEGAARDIVWTPQGELRKMSADEKEAFEKKREEQRFQGARVVARQRMIQVGNEVVSYRRKNEKWPAALSDCKRTGDSTEDAAVNACFKDSWGHDFSFKTLPHDNFAVICWGKDGEDGGKGRDADFVITEREIRVIYDEYRNDMGWGGYYDEGDWQVQNLARDILTYQDRFGALPDDLNDLTRGGQAAKKDENGNPVAVQAIRNALPRDRWGNEYAYVKLNASEFYVVGLGKDQLEGGVKEDVDAIYPKPGDDPREDYWGEEPEVFVKPVPQQNDDELLVEIANEVMLDIVEKLNAYKAANGTYPGSLDDLMDEFVDGVVPLDPWENEFTYTLTKAELETDAGFQLTCFGSDGAEGGDDFAADIVMDQNSKAAEAEENADDGGEDK